MYTTALDEDNYIVPAQSAMMGTFKCRCCGQPVVPELSKPEDLFVYHHSDGDRCDLWYKASVWNMKWQRLVPIEYREVPVEYDDVKHIADIQIGCHTIIFQDSTLGKEDYYEKLAFFQSASNVIWVQNCLDEQIRSTGEAKFGGKKFYWYDADIFPEIQWSKDKKWSGQHYLFLQVLKDMFIEVSWNAEGFRHLTGEYVPKEDFVRRVNRLMSRENIVYNNLLS